MPPPPPLPQLLKNRDRDRLQQYTDALAFYEGKPWPAPDPRTRSARRRPPNYVQTISHNNPPSRHPRAPRRALATRAHPAVLGDAAYKATWDPAEERVAITAPDVRGLFPWPHPTDPTRYTRGAHQYTLPREDAID